MRIAEDDLPRPVDRYRKVSVPKPVPYGPQPKWSTGDTSGPDWGSRDGKGDEVRRNDLLPRTLQKEYPKLI